MLIGCVKEGKLRKKNSRVVAEKHEIVENQQQIKNREREAARSQSRTAFLIRWWSGQKKEIELGGIF
jgi:hypothetical protein